MNIVKGEYVNMEFKVSTKPLSDALNLGVIKENVNAYYSTSVIAQIIAKSSELIINLESENIKTRLTLRGSADFGDDQECLVFVNCLALRQLVSTFEASVTTLEFTEGGLVLHSGNSKFSLPRVSDHQEAALADPYSGDISSRIVSKINTAAWRFLEDHQMYAASMSFMFPIYRFAWSSKDGDLLVGNFDNSLFTHSNKKLLNSTCLLSDTIVTLLNSVPEDAELVELDNTYLLKFSTDGFEYVTEFEPKYETSEEEEGIGSYNANMFLEAMNPDPDKSVTIEVEKLDKFLGQLQIIVTATEYPVKLSVEDNAVVVDADGSLCKIETDNSSEHYVATFNAVLLKSVIANMDSEKINLMCLHDADDENIVAGVLFWTDEMQVMLSTVKE